MLRLQVAKGLQPTLEVEQTTGKASDDGAVTLGTMSDEPPKKVL